jgi:Xaa-Pro aminopeptidase
MAAVGTPSELDMRVWTAVRDARDRVLTLLRDRVVAGARVSGAELDRAAWHELTTHGFGMEHRVARTGHTMDRFGVHGLGPSVDDTETHDDRPLTAGVGFSVEPGIYLIGRTGVRSEVNVHVGQRDILVTPHPYQRELISV